MYLPSFDSVREWSATHWSVCIWLPGLRTPFETCVPKYPARVLSPALSGAWSVWMDDHDVPADAR